MIRYIAGRLIGWLRSPEAVLPSRCTKMSGSINDYTETIMNLGCFSVSLTVKDLQKSKEFYEKIGFEVYAGDESHNFLIMKNGETNIGLLT